MEDDDQPLTPYLFDRLYVVRATGFDRSMLPTSAPSAAFRFS